MNLISVRYTIDRIIYKICEHLGGKLVKLIYGGMWSISADARRESISRYGT